METIADATEMRLVGGNLALDFLNTRAGPPEGPPDEEALTDYRALVDWSAHAGALTDAEAAALHRAAEERPRAASAVFSRALRTRDYLDDLFRPLTAGRSPSEAVLERLRTDEADAIEHATLAQGQVFAWTWEDDTTLARPLRPIVHAAVQLLTAGPLKRLKACGGCSFLFYDESKNRSRRWCSMDDCGAAEKSRRYVAARRTRNAR